MPTDKEKAATSDKENAATEDKLNRLRNPCSNAKPRAGKHLHACPDIIKGRDAIRNQLDRTTINIKILSLH